MAAPMRKVVGFKHLANIARNFNKYTPELLKCHQTKLTQQSHALSTSRGKGFVRDKRGFLKMVGVFTVGCGVTVYASSLLERAQSRPSVSAGNITKPDFKPIRVIKSETDKTGLDLTLYQYQTCPFCCKVRAFLDYHGFSYKVVEVNSVRRTQLKWTKYPKVPVMVIDGIGENGFLQVNDSSVIISLLETYLEDPTLTPDKILSFYPALEETKGRKTVYEYPNKYFIMYGDKKLQTTSKERSEERKWRRWVDAELVHVLSPNIYRSPSEALASFRYFSEIGQWEKVFSAAERTIVIYVGAAAMYVVGKLLKHKYKLKEDVRESLFDELNVWIKAVGKKNNFMGGDQPNLADLAVYGSLSAIEGCQAWKEARLNTDIGRWYDRTKQLVDNHAGSHPLNAKHT